MHICTILEIVSFDIKMWQMRLEFLKPALFSESIKLVKTYATKIQNKPVYLLEFHVIREPVATPPPLP